MQFPEEMQIQMNLNIKKPTLVLSNSLDGEQACANTVHTHGLFPILRYPCNSLGVLVKSGFDFAKTKLPKNGVICFLHVQYADPEILNWILDEINTGEFAVLLSGKSCNLSVQSLCDVIRM